MFRCQTCDTIVPAGTRSSKIVVQSRPRTYEPRGADPRERGRFGRGRRKPTKKKAEYDKGGVGTEIVREIMVCPTCAETHHAEAAAEAARIAALEPVVAPIEIGAAAEAEPVEAE